jgi:DNA end-binding protein Ku
MPPRPFWKGYLKLSLVTCPVAMTPAITESEKVRFHTLNRKSGNRVVSRYVDAVSGKPVDEDDEVKGYPRGEDDFVLLEDDELEAVGLESTRTIDIDMFVPADSIDWIWYDKPHYLTPDDPVGEEAFSVIRDAMESTRTVGVSRLVMYRRERAVMLEPRDNGIVLWTLRYGDEVRNPNDYFGKIDAGKPDPKLMSLAVTLIEERSKPWDRSMVRDPVQERLLDIIASKKKGKKRPARATVEPEAPPRNVISIVDALRKSISSEAKSPKHR